MLGRDGGYLWIARDPASRYQGWFCQIGDDLIKIIDDIRPDAAGGFLALENDFWRVKESGKQPGIFFSSRAKLLGL